MAMRHPSSPEKDALDGCAQLLQKLQAIVDELRYAMRTAMQPHGLRDVHFLLLWNCQAAKDYGVAQRELATALSLSPAQVSGLVEELRQRTLLASHRPTSDRRQQRWRLTADGQRLLQEVVSDELGAWAQRFMTSSNSDAADPFTLLGQRLPIAAQDDALQDTDEGCDERPQRGAA